MYLGQFVFPHANHLPAVSAQSAVYAAVAGPVALELGFPEGGVGLGLGRVLGAAVHEDRGLALGLMVGQLVPSGESYPISSRIEGLVWCVDC